MRVLQYKSESTVAGGKLQRKRDGRGETSVRTEELSGSRLVSSRVAVFRTHPFYLSTDAASFELSLLLVSSPSPIFLIVAPIKKKKIIGLPNWTLVQRLPFWSEQVVRVCVRACVPGKYVTQHITSPLLPYMLFGHSHTSLDAEGSLPLRQHKASSGEP